MTDDAALRARDDIAVVDLTPHPAGCLPLIEALLQAGKHLLSQKPFAPDLDTGERLCALAEAKGLHLAVNQNGRWAPLSGLDAGGAGGAGDVGACRPALGPPLDRGHALCGDPGYRDV